MIPISANANGCFAGPIWVDEEYDDISWRHRVCWVPLECPLQGNGYWRKDNMVSIDASITAIILRLNELGHETQFCCSGLPEDHISHPDYAGGYILFSDRAPKELIPAGVIISWEGCHLRFDNDLNKAREQWQWLAGRLGVTLL